MIKREGDVMNGVCMSERLSVKDREQREGKECREPILVKKRRGGWGRREEDKIRGVWLGTRMNRWNAL